MTNTSDSLKEHNLRLTGCRADVLEVLQQAGRALSQGELEGRVSDHYDRVTVYRTIKTFLDKGLIHKVLDDGGTRYALCRDACGHKHHHDHVHFKCSSCGETNCLESVVIPKFKLPSGYKMKEMNLLVEGTCAKCEGKLKP